MKRALLVRLLPLLIAALPSCWARESVEKSFVSCEAAPLTGCVGADVFRNRNQTCGPHEITAVEGPREMDGKCCYLVTVSKVDEVGGGSGACAFTD